MLGGVRVARLRWPLYVPCVSYHYFKSTYNPFAASQPRVGILSLSLTGVTGTGRVKMMVVKLWVVYVVMWGLVSLGHWC